MGFLPLKTARSIDVYKNGTPVQLNATLDFMALSDTQAAKFNELLQNPPLSTDVSNIGFWHNIPTNPIFTPESLATGLLFGSYCSNWCLSTYLYDVLTNVNDEVIFYNTNQGHNYGFGFRYYQTVSTTQKSVDFIYINNGTKTYTAPGQAFTIGTSGSGADTRYWRFFVGVMIDFNVQRAYPFVVQGAYYLPTRSSDNMRVRASSFSSAPITISFEEAMYRVFYDVPPEPVVDPYTDGGISEEGGGGGSFDNTSDSIGVPSLPSMSAHNVGLLSLFTIDETNIGKLADYLLNPNSVFTELEKVWNSPMDAILCLNYMPFTPPHNATAQTIKFGSSSTGADGNLLNDQYAEVDCGTLTIDEYYASCLDYSPYTSISLVLPYATAVELDPDEVMGHTIGIIYKIDCYTGAGVAIISDENRVLMQIPVNVGNPVPLSAASYASVYGAIASQVITVAATVGSVALGVVATPAAAIAAGGAVMAATAGNVMGAKVKYNHGGSGGAGTGIFGVQTPYVIIKRPRQCLPDNNNNFQGYPLYITDTLNNFTGFTKIADIHLDGIDATDGEKRELEAILKGGVFI